MLQVYIGSGTVVAEYLLPAILGNFIFKEF